MAGAAQRMMASGAKPQTAVVMLNMGGPSSLKGEEDGVAAFLTRLFGDREIIRLGPFQDWLSKFIVWRRTPAIVEQYRQIGGRSPIREWTDKQGEDMCRKLDELSPDTAPHKAYTCFRYAPPLTEEVLDAMAADGVTRAVAFSQFPQFSCTTAGSSYNHLWRTLLEKGMESRFIWSVLDRWPTHPTYVKALAQRVEEALNTLPADKRDKAILLFTAHSLPMYVVERGDPYPQEVAATVQAVVEALPQPQRHLLAWQSKVGPLPWLTPSTGNAIQGLAAQGHRHIVAVPIAFTSDHIETLYEIGIEYAEEAEKAGVDDFVCARGLNDSDLLTTAQAELVARHLADQQVCTAQYQLNCIECNNPTCRTVLNPVAPYVKLRDAYDEPSSVATWPEGAPRPGSAADVRAAAVGRAAAGADK